jgi:hypothetical protein
MFFNVKRLIFCIIKYSDCLVFVFAIEEMKQCNQFFNNVRFEDFFATSNEILGWEGVGNRQLLCFFKA